MIKFGTSGRRAIMGREFTFHNVRIVVQAIANHLRRNFQAGRSPSSSTTTPASFPNVSPLKPPILSHNQIRVLLSDRDAPSQAQALQIIMRGPGGDQLHRFFQPAGVQRSQIQRRNGRARASGCHGCHRGRGPSAGQNPLFIPVLPPDGKRSDDRLPGDYLEFLQNKIDFAAIRNPSCGSASTFSSGES